jgi:hypothetical protein
MNAPVGAADPVFARGGGLWHPHPEAGGPFGGLHGGAISGLIVAEMEREARARDLGLALSATVLLLRPAPRAPLETRTEILRQGGRTGVLETVLIAGDKLVAKGSAAFVTPLAIADTPAAAARAYDPSSLPPWEQIRRFEHRTLFDALDIRDDGQGTKWGRLRRPLVDFPAPLATLFAVADNATAFYLTARSDQAPPYGFPNIDIAIHVSRPPSGGWVGVTPHSDWRPEGRGYTEAVLQDEHGPLGRVCQTVVLIAR